MVNWKKIIEDNREEIEAALIRQWVNSLDETPGDDLRQHAVELRQDGTVLEYITEAHHTSVDILNGKSILVYQFPGARREGYIDEHYDGDTQAWIIDMQEFHPLDTDTIIDDIITEVADRAK
ncbi:hypothetical protein [Sporomusa sphaeroides]|uniref:DUF551 domain-containing protein n=1 Tax=Sporomusa sphaeroides DSM 2875 TaxID=1337886 RepID=A0ABM9VZU3_9FIRM|nr:hypothetical protein [Sporomusa sphaeroides]OLS56340.1 hypothetical protein SPSPH_27330 [Sporomusa sphaeroides DSM 2875]CVK18435.1 hypothetical protein SSPH_01073 [Sporomusa sphaeroides DSM 2875]